MPGGGTRTFLELDHYEAGLRQAQIDAVIVSQGKFRARLTWAELHHLQVLRCEEDCSRVAYVQFAQQLAFVTFPAHPSPLPVWCGMELQAHEIMFHSCGERLHQLIPKSFIWGVIAMGPAQLEHYARALSGKSFASPPEGRVLQPSPRLVARLRRHHAQACRLAETKSKILSHSEVARAIEQDLIQALVICLTTAGVRTDGFAARHHASIMIRFEEVLAEHLSQPPNVPELCRLIGVSDRTLRSCCAEFLGMTPTRYMLLRRLRKVRSALGNADPHMENVSEIAHRFGFAELGRFAGTYRATFGETPSATLQRIPKTRFIAP
jgi:AraC-like DNA-binding protein